MRDFQVIPAEAAAKEAAELSGRPKEWQFYLSDARRILEAAAPYMLAEAWDEAIQAADDEGYLYTHQSDAMKARNPYRRCR